MLKGNVWFWSILLSSLTVISIENSYSVDNIIPVAVDDTFLGYKNTPLVVTAPGVLANDYDVDGNPLTSILENTVENGALNLNGDGSFIFTPPNNFIGVVSFTYHAYDGKDSGNNANVFITVSDQNPPGNEIDEIEEVIETVESLAIMGESISPQHIDALIVKLETAIAKLEQGQTNSAINNLEAFINQINALVNSGKLSEEAGQSLIFDVQNIINHLQ